MPAPQLTPFSSWALHHEYHLQYLALVLAQRAVSDLSFKCILSLSSLPLPFPFSFPSHTLLSLPPFCSLYGPTKSDKQLCLYSMLGFPHLFPIIVSAHHQPPTAFPTLAPLISSAQSPLAVLSPGHIPGSVCTQCCPPSPPGLGPIEPAAAWKRAPRPRAAAELRVPARVPPVSPSAVLGSRGQDLHFPCSIL